MRFFLFFRNINDRLDIKIFEYLLKIILLNIY